MDPLNPNDYEIKRESVSTIVKEPVIDYENYSSIDKISRIIGWIRRFINNYCKRKSEPLIQTRYLLPGEVNKAMTIVVLKAQTEFAEDFKHMEKNNAVAKKSKLAPFKPFIDNQGIIRIGGRLKNAEIPFNAKHQILLTSGHIALLIARKHHLKCGHAGVNQLLSELRQ